MRFWSLSCEYLDNIGLSRLYNEGIDGLKYLQKIPCRHKYGHSQLIRFNKTKYPIETLSKYLFIVRGELLKRNMITGSKFNSCLLISSNNFNNISVTDKQIDFERKWLLNKLEKRILKYPKSNAKEKFELLTNENIIKLNSIFYSIEGDIESWEKCVL